MSKPKFIIILSGAVAVAAIALGFQILRSRSSAPGGVSGACTVDSPADSAGCSAAGASPVAGLGKSDQAPSSQASAVRSESAAEPVSVQLQMKILNQILTSKNDNDPRLDRELRVLTPAARRLMRARYDDLAAEKRNERGTIVFLVGRNLETSQDFDFLSAVVNEAPCRSLKDCQSADAMDSHDTTGAEMGIDMTLNYPQIVALKSLERLLSGSPSPTQDQRERSLKVIREAMASPVRAISGMATDLYNRYGGKSGT